MAAAAGGALLPASAKAGDPVVVGALRFTSSGPVFIARDRGYFSAEGLDVDLRFFEAAPSIAVATTTGDVALGVTALTGAFFNLASRGGLRILAGQAREEKGHSGNLVLVRKAVFDGAVTTLPMLFSQPFGLTQFGSPSHYQLGQLARIHGVAMSTVKIRAFQTLPNLVAAIRGGQVTWAIIAPPVATELIATGDMVALSRYSDYGSYQFGVLFATERTIEERGAMVRGFLRAYVRGLQDYAVLNALAAGDREQAARARDVAAIIARYVYRTEDPESGIRKVQENAFYVDPAGHVDVDDIERQIRWYREQGLVRDDIGPRELLRLDLLPDRP
jgi:NitT/TauT family transport system substrate-binding protein